MIYDTKDIKRPNGFLCFMLCCKQSSNAIMIKSSPFLIQKYAEYAHILSVATTNISKLIFNK